MVEKKNNMTKLPPNHDSLRVAALLRYRDLDYSNASEFETITQLAADICDVPIALVGFVDTNDVKLHFTCGLDGVENVPRDISFCSHTVNAADFFEIPDTLKDPQFKNSPLVVNDPKFRFYAGVPIFTYDGYAIGTLCVLDYKPKKLSSLQKKTLTQLSTIISKSLESKFLETEKRIQESLSRLFVTNAPISIHGIDMHGCFTCMNPSGLKMWGLKSEDEIKGVKYLSGVAEKDFNRIKHLLEKALQGEKSNFEVIGKSGSIYFSSLIPIKNDQGVVIKLMGISENITERRKAEEKLAKEMERLELVMHATNESVWDMDKITNTVWWNDTYTNTFGRPPEENTWDWWLDRIHPNDRSRVCNSFALIDKSNCQRWNEEYRFQLPDGSYAHVQDRAYIACDETGKVTRILGVIRDVTESKHAEQELREHNIALSHSLPGIARLDKSGRYLYVNEIYASLLGYRPDELIGQSWKMTVARKDIKTGLHGYRRMLSEDKVEFDLKSIRKDGSPIFKHLLIAKCVDDNGNFIGLNCFIKNITEQKRAEQNARELNLALSHSLPGIARINPDGCYDYVNEIYAGLLGYTPDELIGQSWKVTVDPQHIEVGERGYQRMLEEDNVEFDIKGIRKDGSLIYKHVLIVRRVDDDGYFIGHHCFMKDITKRIEAEQKHKQLQNELNHVSRLSNMDEMATGLAHEINQPLTAISHYCDAAQTLLASEPIDNEKLSGFLRGVSEQAHRAGEIVRHCRQFASKQTMEKCVVNLNELTQETVRFLSSDAHDRNISIQIALDEKLPPVKVDKVQIQQVLVNLIRNGLEAMENNNGTARKLTVRTHLNGKNENKPELQVTVKDTGAGFKISQLDNLFQPFYTTKTNGMGMGLSISRTIIHAHGGKLWADSQFNKETQFHFTLPINRE